MFTDSRRLEKPRALLPHCISSTGGVWADIGCGDGVFTTVLQEIIGPGGRIVAVDIDAGALKQLRDRFGQHHPQVDVETVLADFTAPLALPELDGFVIANALHFVDPNLRSGVFTDLAAHLKPGGRTIVVEYNTHASSPAVPFPLDLDGFLALAMAAGLEAGHIAARVPSSFLGEMYAGVALKRAPRLVSPYSPTSLPPPPA
jgi:ubiquinone/menaquinone biosynthesis C-methylase UbiE